VRRLPLLLTVALGSALLFAVQPLAGKWLLPWFGGAPAVWGTCLLFFQLAVLAGYGWAAWLLTRSPRVQVLGHLAVVALALATLPLRPDGAWADAHLPPAVAVLALLVGELGLPAVALATTAPLIQGWAARLAPGRDPYRLAAVSSAGSLLALLAYPLLIEPRLGRSAQAAAFTGGMILYAGLVLWSATRLRRLPAPAEPVAMAPAPAAPERWLWVVLPATATLLLASITEVLCQDVAPVPFLWVVPLALYLVSWILVYAGPWGYHRGPALALLVLGNLAVGLLQAWPQAPLPAAISIHLAALFAACWCCHGETVRRRPPPAGLGAFHFASAIGGVAGTAVVVFIAPLVFAGRLEHRFGLILAAVLTVYASRSGAARRISGWLVLGATAVAIAAMALLPRLVLAPGERLLAMERSFFGVLSVRELDTADGAHQRRELHHGITTHGRQMLAPGAQRLPTTYYGHSSGIGLALDRLARPGRRVGVVGLGAGTLATYARPGDHWRFYELDPRVEALARRWFGFLATAQGEVGVSIGDGRRLLAADAGARYDLLALDAFSSDAIPVHLLTLEAFALYRDRLAPDGVIAVHISNRHLDLRPVVRAAALRQGWPCLVIEDEPDEEDRRICEPSIWVLTGPDPTLASDRRLIGRAQAADFPPVVVPWSDERADLLSVWR
jgi:SAM-dependent methyltransferase